MSYAELSTWKSSTIKETFYNAVDQTLRVTFHSGASYLYEGVEEAEYNSFRESESKGSFFSKNFRNKKYTKLEEIKDATADTQDTTR